MKNSLSYTHKVCICKVRLYTILGLNVVLVKKKKLEVESRFFFVYKTGITSEPK